MLKMVRERVFNLSIDRFRSSYSQHVEIDLERLCSVKTAIDSIIKNQKTNMKIIIHDEINGNETSQTLEVSIDDKPTSIIKQYFKIKLRDLLQSDDLLEPILKDYLSIYVLNVCGCNDVLFSDEYPIRSYKVHI